MGELCEVRHGLQESDLCFCGVGLLGHHQDFQRGACNCVFSVRVRALYLVLFFLCKTWVCVCARMCGV